MSTLLARALVFATEAHGSQKRKYTNEPYIVHPVAVATLVASVTDDEEVIAAALLHDTVEDTPTTFHQLEILFGYRVAMLVEQVTDVSKLTDGNRAERKELDRQHLKLAGPEAKTIKLADLLDNTESIVVHDSAFAEIYLAEKELLLEVLTEGNAILYNQATQIIKEWKHD